VSGGLTGGSLIDAQIAGVVGQNSVENNNLDILREEESKRELELTTKYKWTSKQLTDYITNKSRASIKGFADGAVESIEGTVNAVRHPVDTAKGIYGVISDPSAVFNSIELSVKEWDELYAYALQTNPGLAGKMEGYLSGKVGGSLTGGYLITGGAAKIVSSLAKSKYATKIKEIAQEAGKGANVGKGVSNTSTLNPNEIRFSQNTVSYSKTDRVTGSKYTYDDLVTSMKNTGWKGDPVDVVKMPDGKITSMDNTRITAAREAGIDVKATIHDFNEKLTPEIQKARGWERYNTWGEAIQGRINKQSGGFGKQNPNGSIESPKIKGKK
jgi:hypothetical protein